VTAAQALAYVRGGEYVGPEHLKELAAPVMRHRLILRPQSVLGGRTADQIIGEVLEETPLPITLGDLER
jgi:MoxR-like ATPase